MEAKYKAISIGSDHGGVDAKAAIVFHLKSLGIAVNDRGTYTKDSCDYPIYAYKVAKDVAMKKADFGILICNTGIGMEMAANKVEGIRAALLYNNDVARLAKEHNDANVITFGAHYFTSEQMIGMIDSYMKADFLGDRHARRVKEIGKIQEGKDPEIGK